MKITLTILVLILSTICVFAQSDQDAYTKAANAIVRGKSAIEMDSLYRNMVNQFSSYREQLSPNAKDITTRAVAYAYIAAHDTVKANSYLSLLCDTATLPTQYYGMVKAAQKQSLDVYAENLLKQTITLYERLDLKLIANPKGDPLGLANNREKYAVLFYTDYALALTKSGKKQIGLDYARKAYRVNKEDKIAISTYAKLLSLNNMYVESLPILEEAVLKGVADSTLLESYKKAYTYVNGEKGFQERFSALQMQQEESTLAEMREKMVSERAPDFNLQDLNGKNWTLEELKGKIVVLDFWATWCAPCKKSFPAMQMAVNKYKNDPSVVFLFIHTWERESDAPKVAAKFIADNNYNLQVLMDLKKDGNNQMVSSYKVSGIPAKFIIDGRGNIRFKMTGFSGSNEEAVRELSAMIALTKL